jgi:hypothetical protein
MCGFPLSYPIYFLQALASMATDELKPPTLLCGFGGERETVDFIAQAVASIDFEPSAQSCGFGSEREVNTKDLRNRNVMVDGNSNGDGDGDGNGNGKGNGKGDGTVAL